MCSALLNLSAALKRGGLAAVILGTGLAGLCPAQTTVAPESSIFKARTDLVALDITVRDKAGRVVEGLTPDDFLVLEDNVPQRVAFFSACGRLPLSVVLLVDESASMAGDRLARGVVSAATFLRNLDPDDLVEVLAFNDGQVRAYPLGSDRSAAEQALATLAPQGETRLFDAVLVALRDLEHAERGRTGERQNVLVVLSDGEDSQSRLAFDDVLEDARRSSASIDVISLRTDGQGQWLPPRFELSQLAFDTGGEAVSPQNPSDLESVAEDMGRDLRRRYRVGYVSSSPASDGRWRHVSVRVAGQQLVVRTRAGYYARDTGISSSGSQKDSVTQR